MINDIRCDVMCSLSSIWTFGKFFLPSYSLIYIHISFHNHFTAFQLNDNPVPKKSNNMIDWFRFRPKATTKKRPFGTKQKRDDTSLQNHDFGARSFGWWFVFQRNRYGLYIQITSTKKGWPFMGLLLNSPVTGNINIINPPSLHFP